MTASTANGTVRNRTSTEALQRRTLSTRDLAQSLNRSTEWTESLLAESERDGVVERAGDRWRLTKEGERRVGAALRALSLPQGGV
jgi:Mn-dependent DtxR family transcriptional regulator